MAHLPQCEIANSASANSLRRGSCPNLYEASNGSSRPNINVSPVDAGCALKCCDGRTMSGSRERIDYGVDRGHVAFLCFRRLLRVDTQIMAAKSREDFLNRESWMQREGLRLQGRVARAIGSAAVSRRRMKLGPLLSPDRNGSISDAPFPAFETNILRRHLSNDDLGSRLRCACRRRRTRWARRCNSSANERS